MELFQKECKSVPDVLSAEPLLSHYACGYDAAAKISPHDRRTASVGQHTGRTDHIQRHCPSDPGLPVLRPAFGGFPTASFQHIHLVGSILHYVEQNLSEKLFLQDIAEKYNYSVTYISKLFKNVTGSSLVSYIIEKRIARARQLMYEDLEITEIAERVGYHNYSNFYKAFKKAVGISPEEYRRQLNTFGK